MNNNTSDWGDYCYRLLLENPFYLESESEKFLLMLENKGLLHEYTSGMQLEKDYINWLENKQEE